jgi:hypothetical protein
MRLSEVELDGEVLRVPLSQKPLYWDRRLPVSANVQMVQTYIDKYTPMLPTGCYFDEASILAPGIGAKEGLVRELMVGGWRLFNEATDLVFTNPFGTRYAVAYTFLRHPHRTWRLEVMRMDEATRDKRYGFSPLHQALWYPEGAVPTWGQWSELPIPHLSFKVPTQRAYSDTIKAMQANAFIHAQTCQSTYGAFSYWIHNDAMRQVYVKPRVNLRDGGEG